MLAASLGADPERMEAREMLEAFEAERITSEMREREEKGEQPVGQDGCKGSMMRTWSGLGRHHGGSAISVGWPKVHVLLALAEQ